MIKTLPVFLFLIFYLRSNIEKNKLFQIFFFSFYFITIYLSGERTSLALTMIFIALVIFFIKPLKKIFIYSLILLIFFISLTSFNKFGKIDIFNRIVKLSFNQITNYLFIEGESIIISKDKLIESNTTLKENLKLFTGEHQGHYQLALNLFDQNPILGVGPKGFRFHCRKIDFYSEIGICSTHPHNTAIQILAETGFIGFSLYVIFLFFLMFKIFVFRKKI